MFGSKKRDRHARLVERMAEARGVDIDEEIQRGNLSQNTADEAVSKCLGCAHVSNCEVWLEQQKGEVGATPEYCRNADLFSALSKD